MASSSQPDVQFLYLHGFASSPRSRKAIFFKDRLEQLGYSCLVPDLNLPSFEKLSITAQIDYCSNLIDSLANDSQLILIGSSMGGLLATLLEQKYQGRNITNLILLAPGFGITRRWPQIIGEAGMKHWNENGYRQFFHYAHNQELPLHYEFAQNLEKLQTDNFSVNVPTLIFHGIDDQTVPIEHSREFVELNRSMATLIELNDSHELANSLELIWSQSLLLIESLSTASGSA